MANAKPKSIDLRSLCRSFTEANVRTLGGFASSPEVAPAVRVSAISLLLERGWGKAAQPHTGEDGEGGIEITVRIINEGRGPTKVLDLTPVDAQQLTKRSGDES